MDAFSNIRICNNKEAFLYRLSNEGKKIESFRINTHEFVIGRHPSCSLLVKSPHVSEIQCKILRDEDNNFYIENYDYNYIAVNNQYFCQVKQLLKNNDVISLDNEFFLFSTDSQRTTNVVEHKFVTPYIRPPKPRRKKSEKKTKNSRQKGPSIALTEIPEPIHLDQVTNFGRKVVPSQRLREFSMEDQMDYLSEPGKNNVCTSSEETKNSRENNSESEDKKTSDEDPSTDDFVLERMITSSSECESISSTEEKKSEGSFVKLPFEWLIVCDGQVRNSLRHKLRYDYFSKRVLTNQDGSYRQFMNMSDFKLPRKIINPRKEILKALSEKNSPENKISEEKEVEESPTKSESPKKVEEETQSIDPAPRKRGRKKKVKPVEPEPTIIPPRVRGRKPLKPKTTTTKIQETRSPSPPKPKLRGRPPKQLRGKRALPSSSSSNVVKGRSVSKYSKRDR